MIKSNTKDFLLYVIVGGIATISEWTSFYFLNKFLHYTMSVIVAYIFSTFVNWASGRILVFKKSDKSLFKELLEIYIVGIIGLLFNLIIMWVGVDLLSVNKMLAKIAATGIVFFYHFFVRKLIIYKK